MLRLLALACSLPFLGPQDPAPETLLVLSYNIRYGTARDGDDAWEQRKELCIDVVREREPDVVGMQEVLAFQREAFLDALPAYAAFGVGREEGGRGEESCILYREDRLERLDGGTFWLSETPEVVASKSWDSSLPRICTWARFRTRSGGRAFYVFNTHLDHRGREARVESAKLIRARIERREHADPAVLTGDLNAPEGSEPLQIVLQSLRDPFREKHPDAQGVGTYHGFRGGTGGGKIDFVLATEGFETLSAEILHDREGDRYPSDHYPVCAELRLR